ncbi:MAG TPA: ABC transporter permease [Vicinamibacterales bacterium]|jgi:cell division transport system permease protein|nr:ABC transporter permease [Vicinamibacterales bacterium]
MRAIDYALREAWASLWRGGRSAAFAVLAITLAAVVLGAILLVSWNVDRLLTQWTAASEFSVFLRDDATSEQRGAIEAAIDQSGVTEGHEYVSKAEALTRFRSQFADLASLTSDLGDNPFPASLEVRVRADAEQNGRADVLVKRIAAQPGVADVRYDREWLSRVSNALGAIRGAGFALALLMALAAAVTVAAVVRLGLHARRDEIEIMKLVGSPVAFIRGPFVAEGFLQGGLGAVIAIVLLWAGFALVRAWWGGDLSTVLDGAVLQFLPVRTVVLLVAGAMFVGAAGGFAASRHAG